MVWGCIYLFPLQSLCCKLYACWGGSSLMVPYEKNNHMISSVNNATVTTPAVTKLGTRWLLKASAVVRNGAVFRAGKISWQGGDSLPLGYGRQHEAQPCEGEQREQGVAQNSQALREIGRCWPIPVA